MEIEGNATPRKYVLIGEDDEFYANIYKTRLSEAGYEVEVAPNGAELMKLVFQRKPDLIMLDLIMPVKDGFATLTELKKSEETKDIDVVVLSTLGQSEDVEKAKAMGAVDYISKNSSSFGEIVDKIKAHIR